jgi:hypothetical protein
LDLGEDSEVDSMMEDFLAGPGSHAPALFAAQKIWLAQGEEAELLRLILCLEEINGPESNMTVEAQGPAFVIRPGSLLADFIRGAFRVPIWALCFVASGGTTTSARRAGMVQRLRETAIKTSPKLQDIHSLVAPPSRPLVVLIHGLFGTDVGTFRSLQPLLEEHFEVVGFPHDTLYSAFKSSRSCPQQTSSSLNHVPSVLVGAQSSQLLLGSYVHCGLLCPAAAPRREGFKGDQFAANGLVNEPPNRANLRHAGSGGLGVPDRRPADSLISYVKSFFSKVPK